MGRAKGYGHSTETKKKLAEKIRIIAKAKGFGRWMKGKKHSSETKRKMSEYRKGKHWKWKEESKKRFSEIKKGTICSEETRRKMSLAQTGRKHTEASKKKMSENNKGKNGSNWKGGVSPKNAIIRRSLEYRLWRESVFRRDNWTCIWCGAKGGTKSNMGNRIILNADHIKPFSDYPELRFAIDNGRTLCESCHKTTDTYGIH